MKVSDATRGRRLAALNHRHKRNAKVIDFAKAVARKAARAFDPQPEVLVAAA